MVRNMSINLTTRKKKKTENPVSATKNERTNSYVFQVEGYFFMGFVFLVWRVVSSARRFNLGGLSGSQNTNYK